MQLWRGNLDLHASFELGTGETVALLGPNGAGKSTVLHTLAGLVRIDSGSLRVDTEVWDGGPKGPFVPPELRGVGFVFQDHLLFPHLSVLENVAYGPRSRGSRRPVAHAVAREWLARVGLLEQQQTLPKQLSGGQAQRVALARALATRPKLLLLDEPLASVDATAKLRLCNELRLHLGAFDGLRLLVVHDLSDALALADRILIMEAGKIVQAGTYAQIVSHPHSEYVANLVGVNRVRGTCKAGMVTLAGVSLATETPCAGPVIVTFPPRAVAIARHPTKQAIPHPFQVRVVGLESLNDRVRVHLDGPFPLFAEIAHAAADKLRLQMGDQVWMGVAPNEFHVFQAP